MSNFDDLALAVESFGSNNKVIFDDIGMPSITVGVPKMKYSDLIAGGTQETLPFWIVDGVEKDAIWVSKFQNVVLHDRAYSLPLRDPRASINFDQALEACRKKVAFEPERSFYGAGIALQEKRENTAWKQQLWTGCFLPVGEGHTGGSGWKHREDHKNAHRVRPGHLV